MAIYIVTYDLNREVVRPNITAGLKKHFPAWARLSESSYAIETSFTPGQVLSALRQYVDANDTMYVITLRQPHSGFGPKDVNEWLATKLT